MDLKNLHLESITLPDGYKEIILDRREITPELEALGFRKGTWGKDRRYNFFLKMLDPFKLRAIEENVEIAETTGVLHYHIEIETNHPLFKPVKLQQYVKEHKVGKEYNKFNQKLGVWIDGEIEQLSGVELYSEVYLQMPENQTYILYQTTEEKVYKQLLIDISTALRKLDGAVANVKDATADMKISAYKGHANADLERNQFVVDVKNPDSIAAALKYQIDNADEFIARLKEIVSEGYEGLSYGVIEEDEFENLHLLEEYSGYDEEIIANELAKHPRLYPLVAEYIKQVVLPASEAEKTSGPWATEETILGQFIVPMLAEQDEQYYPLLVQLVKTNVEIRCSPRFQNWFDYVEVPEEEDDDEDNDWDDDEDEGDDDNDWSEDDGDDTDEDESLAEFHLEDSPELYKQSADGINVDDLLKQLSEEPSTNESVKNSEFNFTQLYNNKAFSSLLGAIYKLAELTDEEKNMISIFTNRVKLYDEHYINFLPDSTLLQLACTRKSNDYQILTVMCSGGDAQCISLMASGGVPFAKYSISPKLLAFLKEFLKEYQQEGVLKF